MSAETDLALLRRFEPIARYTRGEQFYPLYVEPYVRRSGLWVRHRNGDSVLLVPPVIAIHGTSDSAFQPHDESEGDTVMLKSLDAESADCAAGVSTNRQSVRPSCFTVNDALPSTHTTFTVPVRLAVVAFGSTLKLMVPVPTPFRSARRIQDSVELARQPQPGACVLASAVKLPRPPFDAICCVVRSSVYAQPDDPAETSAINES